ncbi:MAG: ATP-binding protein [Bacteroidetes bacterium]|nr:MAG: ATP-binding protein [Bacteroidota bacterium]
MKYIARVQEARLLESLRPQKVTLLLGARRTGKTVLVKRILERVEEPFLFLQGENIATQELLSRRTTAHFQSLLGDKKLLVIDEAQGIPEIGKVLKLMVDTIEGVKVLVTGSSAFGLAELTGAPLTGRKTTLHLYPISEEELLPEESPEEKRDNLRQRLVFGSYPDLFHLPNREDKIEFLQELLQSYLMKDILAFENVRNAPQLFNLLRLVAYQVGSVVSYNELGRQLGISKNTVIRYLDLFTKVYILFPVGGFSRNLRKEVVKNSKWYFYDNGIRNALIANFNPIEMRNDQGQLWENYVISERVKFQHYHRMVVNNFFWRTYDQQEIDWVEEREGRLFGYEMKWGATRKTKVPRTWLQSYPEAEFQVITPDNFLSWVTPERTSE